MSETDKKEIEYLANLIERGQRGEPVELTFCNVATRLYCIRKRIERQRWLDKWDKIEQADESEE